MPDPPLMPEDVCVGGVFAIRNVLGQVKWSLKDDPAIALSTNVDTARNKVALRVDQEAEDQFRINLKSDYKKGLLKGIEVCGEESISQQFDFTDREGIFALADMIDGTDLLERNLSNWCSAVVFFQPRNKKGSQILAACVGLPSGKIYYAHSDSPYARYESASQRTCNVGGKSSIMKLSEASICFYGQKPDRLRSVVNELPLLKYLAAQPKSQDPKRKQNRVYTLAGIPMIMKLIDRQTEDSANIDVVFETKGQKPHDIVPGAYIAKKAGASVFNLDTGKPITDEELESGLLRPGHGKSELRYVITSTPELGEEILPLLKTEAAIAPAHPQENDTRGKET